MWSDLRADYETRGAPVPVDAMQAICQRHGVSQPANMLNTLVGKKVAVRDGARSRNKGTIPLSNGLTVIVGRGRGAVQIWPEPPRAETCSPEPVPRAASGPPGPKAAASGPVRLSPKQAEAWRVVRAWAEAGNAELRARDVTAPFRDGRIIGRSSSPSAMLGDLEGKGLIERIGGTLRSCSDSSVFRMRLDVEVVVPPPAAVEPAEASPAPPTPPLPTRMKSRADLEAEVEAIDREVAGAEEAERSWEAAARAYDARVADLERQVAEAQEARAAHAAARPRPLDAAALGTRRVRLQGLIENYDLLVVTD